MKPRTLLTTAALIAAALFILDVPAAYADSQTLYFDNAGEGSAWSTVGNWSSDPKTHVAPSDGFAPREDDRAVILSGYTCDVTANEAADTLDVRGTLNIQAGNTLTLDDDNGPAGNHEVSGTLNILGDAESNGGVLSFIDTATQTISDSGTIDLQYYDSTTPANSASILIASGVTLGVSPTVCGSGIIRGDGSYTNNGLLDADDVDGTLSVAIGTTLEDTADSHATRYQVSASGAVLHFDAAITTATGLDGRFVMTVAGTLDFDEPVTSKGRLQLSAGTVYVDANVTLGDQADEEFMLWSGGGTIIVADGCTFNHN